MNCCPLTKELHASCEQLADELFAENTDALLSQILARKPVRAFVVPRLDTVSQKAVLASLCKARKSAIIEPAQIQHEGACILYTRVEIFC